MKITVVGAGAIGGLVAGYLRIKDRDVSLVGHADSVAAIKRRGLNISGKRGNFNIDIPAFERIPERPDLVILAVKTQDCEQAVKDNIEFIQGSLLVTTQNGIRADTLVSACIPKEKIISSIIMFGSTYLRPAEIVHNFEGNWIIGKPFVDNDDKAEHVTGVLNEIFPAVITGDIKGMKYLKLFVNANNCIPAILGLSMQEAFSDLRVSRISIAIWREGMRVISKAGIGLASLPDFPLERINKLTSMPLADAAKVFSGIMTNLSREPVYGSILQSIKRGRASEIDYINGEFISVAQRFSLSAPLNQRLVRMVHDVEKTERFFTKEELIQQADEFIA